MIYRVEMANMSAIENNNYSYYNQIAFNIEIDNLSNLSESIETGYNKLVEIEGDNELWDFEAYTLTGLELIEE